MILRLLHRTTYLYSGDAHHSFNELRLCPVDDALQRRRQFSLRITPTTHLQDYHDFYGNTVHYFDISTPHKKLVIEAESELETTPNSARATVPVVSADALGNNPDGELWTEFLHESPYVPKAVELWREAQDALGGERRDLWADTVRIGTHVYRTFKYKPLSTGINTRATDALEQRTGVCQDFTHVMLGMCRSVGIPARYVSGYFFNESRRPDEIEASHAWVEVMVPGFGWASYDPTHDRPADDRYVKLGVGRDYTDISPVKGTYRGGSTRKLNVEVAVTAEPNVAPL